MLAALKYEIESHPDHQEIDRGASSDKAVDGAGRGGIEIVELQCHILIMSCQRNNLMQSPQYICISIGKVPEY